MDILGCNGGVSGPTQAALTLTLVDQADPVMDGDTFTYTIQVTNTAALTATGIALTFNIDPGLTWVSTTGAGWTLAHPSASVVTATLATLATGAAAPIVVTVTAPGSALAASSSAQITATNAPTNNVTEPTSVVQVTKDGNNNWRRPASFAEWQAVMWKLGVGPPQFYWRMQEPSGDLVDDMQGEVLAAHGAPAYQQAVAGWTSTFVGTTDATALQGFSADTGFAWNFHTQAVFLFDYWRLTTDAARRAFHMLAGGATARVDLLSTGKFQLTPGGGSPNGVSDHRGATDRASTVAWVPGAGVPGYSGAGVYRYSTTLEQINGAWADVSGSGFKGVAAAGQTGQTAATALYNQKAGWVGDDAVTLANVVGEKTFMQRFGITIPW